jgi:hypothetical protein
MRSLVFVALSLLAVRSTRIAPPSPLGDGFVDFGIHSPVPEVPGTMFGVPGILGRIRQARNVVLMRGASVTAEESSQTDHHESRYQDHTKNCKQGRNSNHYFYSLLYLQVYLL